MNASLLRQERVEIWRPVTVQTEYGDYHDDKEYVCSTRAGILNQTMSRQFSNEEIQFPKSKTFIVRHYVPVKDGDLLKWNDQFWVIESAIKNKYFNNIELTTHKEEE